MSFIAAKSCQDGGCEKSATFDLNGRLYCGDHALEAVKAWRGKVPQPKAVK